MGNNCFLKRLILLLCLTIISGNIFCQDKLLSMKIIYSVPIMRSEIKSSIEKDSIEYSFVVDKRFWWQAFDNAILKSQINYDSIVTNLSKTLKERFKREFSIAETKTLIDNNIRRVEFEERWWYDTKTMLIKAEVTAFQPIVTIDSIVFNGDDIAVEEVFSYHLGWFKPILSNKKNEDKIIVASNIEFTMPIYNPIPYQYYFNHLEAEYSLPFLDMLLAKAENVDVKTYEMPTSTAAYSKLEVVKRMGHDELQQIVVEDSLSNVIEKDTIIRMRYNSDDIEYFRFGQQWVFDLETLTFTKQINYFAPVIALSASDGTFRGFYPLFYIRKD
jgi:hypothetical protein